VFLADVMLAKLGRWLRILGIACELPDNPDDGALLSQARKRGLTLLTMDRELAKRAGKLRVKVFLLPHTMTRVDEQLAAVIGKFDLPVGDLKEKTLCTECGGELKVVRSSDVGGKIPADVGKRFEYVWQCRRCGHIYWEGSHWRKIVEKIEKVRKDASDKKSKGTG
jgi:hypothetical protein